MEPYNKLHAKINSKCITDLSEKAEAVKYLQKTTRLNLCDFELGKAFLEMLPKLQVTKETID